METMQGHLMMYPYKVSRNGKVQPAQGYEMFPDAQGAWVVPSRVAAVLPSTLMT
jgi:hypothetical protein